MTWDHRCSTLTRLLARTACAILAGAAFASSAPRAGPEPGVKVKTLASFTSAGTHTDSPNSRLVLASDGNYYGTTLRAWLGMGDGSVFRITRGGKLTIVRRLALDTFPFELVQSSDGKLYGTAEGDNHGDLGSVFRMNLAGDGFEILHRFRGDDGSTPLAGLAIGVDGRLYGTTSDGNGDITGSLYRVANDGSFTLLTLLPARGVVRTTGTLVDAGGGRLMGSASGGSRGLGALFTLARSGALEIVYDFAGPGAEGPSGGLASTPTLSRYLGVSGEGTSPVGWRAQTVFSYDGTTLQTLLAPPIAPVGDYTPLTVGPDGSTFYGFASLSSGHGESVSTLYSISEDGHCEILAGVQGYVAAAPTFTPDGALLGTTIDGGSESLGSVFEVTGL